MNMVRSKIIVFWVLFLLFCALLGYSWNNRMLWLMLFVPAWVIMGFVKPRLPRPSRQAGSLFGFGFLLVLVSVVLHAWHPYSAGWLLLAKIVCVLFLVPALGYKLYRDYDAFRSASGGST